MERTFDGPNEKSTPGAKMEEQATQRLLEDSRLVLAANDLPKSAVPAIDGSDKGMVEGQVVKIDPSAGKITLKHGPIPKFDMDGMTMVFRVNDPSMLKDLKTGDKVNFDLDRINGQLTITKMEKKGKATTNDGKFFPGKPKGGKEEGGCCSSMKH